MELDYSLLNVTKATYNKSFRAVENYFSHLNKNVFSWNFFCIICEYLPTKNVCSLLKSSYHYKYYFITSLKIVQHLVSLYIIFGGCNSSSSIFPSQSAFLFWWALLDGPY